MTDTQLQAWLDQEDQHVAATIRRHGCFIQYVHPCDDPDGHDAEASGCGTGTPFAYSVGFFGLGHPELLIVGTDPGTATAVINELFTRVLDGDDVLPGRLIVFDDWPHRIVAEPVPNPGEIVYTANRHYQRPPEVSVPVLQLTWDDRHGRFPWDAGYSVPAHVQPRPGTFTA